MINNLLFRLALLSMKQVAMITLALTGIYYLIYFDDGRHLKDQIEEKKNILLEEKQKEKKITKIESDLKKYIQATQVDVSNQNKILSLISRNISQKEIIEEINLISKATNVSIREQDPLPTRTFNNIQIFSVKVRVAGNFESIMLFLMNLLKSQKIYKLGDFTLSLDNSSKRGNIDEIIYQGEIVAMKSNPVQVSQTQHSPSVNDSNEIKKGNVQ